MAFKFRKVLAVACATTTLSTAAFAEELRIDRLFVIGDSLSDNGAYTQAVQAVPGATVLGRNQAVLAADPNSTNLLPVPARSPLPPTLDRLRTTNNTVDGNAKVYVEVLADKLGIDLDTNRITAVPLAGTLAAASGDPSYSELTGENVGGTNFAQSGSRAAGTSDSENLAIGINAISATDQVNRLLADGRTFNDSDLVVVWAGSNDVLALTAGVGEAAADAQADALANGATAAQAGAAAQAAAGAATAAAQQTASDAADTLVGLLERIKERGATKVVVVTVPDIGTSTPLGNISEAEGGSAQAQPIFSGLTSVINARLAQQLAGKDVAVVDSNRLLSAVLADPVRYGFDSIDPSTPFYDLDTPQAYECVGRTASTADDSAVGCIQGVTTRSDGKARVFADSIHPTTQAHALFGEAAHSGLIAATQAGAIPVATLTAIRQSSIGIENRLNLGAIYTSDEAGQRIARPVGDFEVYGGAEVGFFTGDEQQVLPGLEAQAQILKVAFDVPVAPKVVVGAGISLDHGQLEFDDNRGGFDSRLVIGALFGVAEVYRGVYVNGLLGYGHIDVYEIDRNFDLGASRESYSADSNGSYFTGKVGVGAMIPLGGGFLINPSVGFTHETVKIDGYGESSNNGGVLARDFGDLEITSNRGTVALAGFFRPEQAQDWIFGLRASYEHDFTSDDLSVASAESGGELASFTAPRPDRDFGFLSGNITHELTEHSALTLGASTVVGLDGVDGITGSLIYKHKF